MAKKSKKAFITGITGQDGSYLAELLLKKGYRVYGLVRQSSNFNRQNIDHIFNTDKKKYIYLHYGDMTDMHSILSVLAKIKPDEIYNLAAQSHVRISFDVPFYTAQTDAIGVLNILEAVRILGLKSKIYQASTSELYSGDPREAPQNEKTPFKPRSPYGAAKLYGFEISRIFREGYGMFVANGILFNHESPRRGSNFVTRKVVKGIIEIKKGLHDKIYLGNLEARRDWGYAPEYMEAAWRMLQKSRPDDYVIATGETHSIRELVEKVCECLDIKIIWQGKGSKEVGIDKKTKKVIIATDPVHYRPNEVDYLCGDASKARKELDWNPKIKFDKLIEIMVKEELKNYDSISQAKFREKRG